MINKELKEYIENNILPMYDTNIGGHGIEHINTVIDRSFEIVKEFNLDVNLDMVYVIAAFHDIGYKTDPDNHEEVSAKMVLEDEYLNNYFDNDTMNIISKAIEEHRASLPHDPETIYGCIVSSADRAIDVDKMLERSVLFQRDKHISENPTELDVIEYSYKKLSSKYGNGGYANMYYEDKKYKDFLTGMQELINNKDKYIEKELSIIDRLKEENRW